jgi:ornithine cyclodeaminase/alanine dehydrogenase-like protein (mu-crystallin family)
VSATEPDVLREEDIRTLVRPPEALAAMRRAFAALDRGDVILPATIDLAFEQANGETDVKGGYIKGDETFAVKWLPASTATPSGAFPPTAASFSCCRPRPAS